MVQQHLGQYQANTYVSDLERQNADWMSRLASAWPLASSITPSASFFFAVAL
jgi:hypothetical protein